MSGGAQATVTKGQEWFILRGDMKYGPYEYRSLITMIQNGELYDYNFVWAPHLENWTLVGDLQDFSKDRLCRLIESKDHLAGSFKDRKVPRVDLTTPVYAHNDHSFFDGQTVSVSENGALVLLNDPLLLPGQKIMLHFRVSEVNSQSFNVLCEIVRKNYSKQRLNVKSGLHYAVRFLEVQGTGSEQLTKWSRGGVAKEETNGIS
ncbi:PilZ domain-containing protein [Bdellovibrio svalbardensis]|uniref:PilZ domain-containing protein n=1 Tax=Bdellovibrio svalbardensis TaxID=2972972 RepID=A0ABT6DNN8_9BACT|nr:PilZ domain-containing protein [Bdellovibrio svalbardensis]MDG0817549.1 PilZ domain-containing protein [Bdellovibrio svalbardensis]